MAIDSLNHEATDWAIRQTKRVFPESPVMVISDKPFYKGGKNDIYVECDPFNKYVHSVICLQGPIQHLETDYALYIQYDGFPVNPKAWTDEFLEYDYIGAPWPHWPEGIQVGNGGFSLRSRKLMELAKDLEPFYDKEHDSYWLEDGMIGIHYRPYLESQGVKFAPVDLAHKFSHEHPFGVKTDSFGFHDKANVEAYLTPNQLQQWKKLIK